MYKNVANAYKVGLHNVHAQNNTIYIYIMVTIFNIY